MSKDYLSLDEKTAFANAMHTNDIGWDCPDLNARKVYLMNPEVAARYDLQDFVSMITGTGHVEWEYLWAYVIVIYSRKAVDKGRSRVDLTNIFDRDFIATKGRRFTRAQVWEHLCYFFKIVEDKKNILKLEIL